MEIFITRCLNALAHLGLGQTHIQGALAIMKSEDPKARRKARNQNIVWILVVSERILP